MQAKPITAFFALALTFMTLVSARAQEAATGDSAAKPPPVIPVVLYADPPTEDDSVPPTIIAARNALRNDRRLEVMLFNPEAPTFVLGARHAALSLSPDAVSSLDQRKAMTEAVGGNFFAVMSRHGKRSKNVDAVLYEIAPVSQSWSFLDRSADDVAVDLAAKLESAGATPDALTPSAPTIPAIPVPQPGAGEQTPVQKPQTPTQAPIPAPPIAAPVPIEKPAPPPTTVTPPVSIPAMIAPAPAPPAPAPPKIMLAPVVAAPKASPPSPVKPAPAPIAVPKIAPVLARSASPQVAPTISATKLPAIAPESVQAPAPIPTVAPPIVAAQTPTPAPIMPVAAPEVPIVAPEVPIVAPAPQPVMNTAPPAATIIPTPEPPAADLPATPPPGSVVSDDARRLMTTGDQQQHASDYYAAIDTYRQAINLAPRAAEPRLKLAQAFLQAGMRDQAISEARRAHAIDPSSQDARDFLTTLGASDTNETQIPTNQANVNANPKDQTAWIALGDSCWNANKLPDALAAYKSAVDLDPDAVAPQARLARFYAAQGEYAKSLTALDKAGGDGYPYALEIIASETENLFGEIDAAEELFDRGENTREQCYKRLKTADKAAQGLADFVAQVKPANAYKLSHLHRQLSTRLLAQDTAGWISYSETGEVRYKSIALTLEKEAIREMETASSAERAQSGAASP